MDHSPTERKNIIRDAEIVRIRKEHHWTIQKLADHYHLTRGRIQQILAIDKKGYDKEHLPITAFPALSDRLDIMYKKVLSEYLKRDNASTRGLIQSIKQHISKTDICRPQKIIDWLKQATNEEIFNVRNIGTRKGIVLMMIRNDIRKNPNKEKILMSRVKKLY